MPNENQQHESNGNLMMWMAVGLALVCLFGSMIIVKRHGWPGSAKKQHSSPVFTPVKNLEAVPVPMSEPERSNNKDSSQGDVSAKSKVITVADVPIKFSGVSTGTISRVDLLNMPQPVRPVAAKQQ